MKNLIWVDQARGLAILLVLLVHTSQSIHGLDPFFVDLAAMGQLGVQFFFVASAYTLCASWEHSHRTQPPSRSSYFGFIIKRYFRVAPLYYAGIFLYLCQNVTLALLRGTDWPSAYTFENIGANLLLVHGAIPAANNSIVPGGWSIGTEVIFYVCFPVFYYLSRPG